MKSNNIICAVVALAVISTQIVVAEGVDKQVEVTRTYTPTIEEATKLTLIPDTTDNTYIKPDIDYSITPISIGTTLQSEPYASTQMSFGEYNRPERFYVKAGAGYPFNTVLDLYASSLKSSKGYVMGYANQEGQFAAIENDYSVKNGSSQNHMRAGAAGGLYLGKRTLEGSLNYNNDRWSRYAATSYYDTYPLYQDVDFNARYGDNFLDMSKLNFALEAYAKYFWNRQDYTSSEFGVRGDVGLNLLGGDLRFALGYNSISGSNEYHDNTFMAGARYGYNNDKLSLAIGLEFYNDNVRIDSEVDVNDYLVDGDFGHFLGGQSDSNYVLPKVNADYKLAGEGAIIYLSANGELRHNDYATLSGVNPYLFSSGLSPLESSVEYDVDFGFKGRFASDRLGYNIHVGYTHILNNIYWAFTDVADITNGFVASSSNQHNLNLNLELEYRPTSNLLLQLGASHRNVTNDKEQLFADGEANTKIDFNGRYSVGKFLLGLNTEVLSSRLCSQIVTQNMAVEIYDIEIPATVNMGLSVDYKHSDKFVIFADVDNILNDDLYNWLHYREYGINFTAGVKIQF